MLQQTTEFTQVFRAGWCNFMKIEEHIAIAKVSPKLNKQKDTLFKAVVIDERGKDSIWAWLHCKKGWEFFFLRTKAYNNELYMFAKRKFYRSLRQEAVLQLGLRCLPKLGSYPPTKTGTQGQHLPWWLYFRGIPAPW